MRGLGRRIRSNFGMGASRMSIRVQTAWYWRWLGNLLLMILVAAVVWWVMENGSRITGPNQEVGRQEAASLAELNRKMREELEAARGTLVEREAKPNEFRYRMLLVQGGQRKQDFKGRVQIVARIARGTDLSTQTYPEADPGEAGAFEFRFYHRVEGRFAIPEDAVLRSVDVRILAVPGGQVKLSRTINMT